jgi:RND family efflux transporter MFP subunit
MRTTITLAAAALLMASCSSKKPIEQPPQAVQARQIESQPRSSREGPRFSAVVMPDAQAPLSFRVSGYVVSLNQVRGQDGKMRDIAEGDRVSQGAVLVRIRQTEYQDKVKEAASQTAAAEAAALKAQHDYERATRLFSSRSITKPEFEAARAQYDATQAQLSGAHAETGEAETALRDTSLIAPFNGEVVKKGVELGCFVGPGLPAFVLARTDVVKIVVGVPDTTMGSIKVGQPVDVAVDAFPNRTFHARISRMSSAGDPTTRNFDVEVAIPNRDHLLKVGMIGSLQFVDTDGQEQNSTISVPLSSIVQSLNGEYGVFVVTNSSAGEIARFRTVEIGTVEGSDISIGRGLASGETIVTIGANLLKDGQRVEVLK